MCGRGDQRCWQDHCVVPFVESDSLNTALQAVDNLGECLLSALTLTHHGYSVELQFEHLRQGRSVPETAVVTVVMKAVQELHVNGYLSQRMVDHPDEINWGLSEVAWVTGYPAAAGVGLRVAWENEREITVEAGRVWFSTSPA